MYPSAPASSPTILSAGMLYGCGSGHPDSDAGNTGGTGEQESVARVDGFILYPDEEGTFYSVGGYEGEGGTLLVPAEYDGLPVSEIGGAAFMNNGEIRSVVLPDSVKSPTALSEGEFASAAAGSDRPAASSRRRVTSIASDMGNSEACAIGRAIV